MHEVRISCSDLVGGRHELIVFGDRDDVVLVLPLGDTAVLAAPGVERLCGLLAPDAGRCRP